MNQLNILALIENCKVEWKTVDEIFDLKNGYTPSKSNQEYWENGTIPWFRMEDIRENGRILNSALQKVSSSAVKSGKLFPANSIIIATSATIGEHALITVPFLANQRFTVLSLKKEFLDKFEITFLFYYCFLLTDWCNKNTTMSSFASVDMVGFRKFQIPIPPLEIQEKIVKILDKFTKLEATLEATLEAELTLRKKQYEFYRNQLLTFDNNSDRGGYNAHPLYQALSAHWNGEVVWKSLGEIAEIKNGKDWKHLNMGEIPVYGSGGIMNYVDKYVYDKPTVLIPRKGTITNLFYIETPFWNVDTIYYTKIASDLIIPKFFYYFLRTLDLEKLDTGSSRPSLTQAILNEIKIPIPPLAVQQKIVEILDKFDTLTHSISQGLPREIELRRKQYEYYREELLTFSNTN